MGDVDMAAAIVTHLIAELASVALYTMSGTGPQTMIALLAGCSGDDKRGAVILGEPGAAALISES